MSSSVASSMSPLSVLLWRFGDQDPLEVTSRRVDFGPFAPRGGLRRSFRQAAVTARHLLDEENVEVQEGGERGVTEEKGDSGQDLGPGEPRGGVLSRGRGRTEGSSPLAHWGSCNLKDLEVDKLVSKFHIPPPFAIYTPLPLGRSFSPPDNCLAFFLAQLRSGLRFPIPPSIPMSPVCFSEYHVWKAHAKSVGKQGGGLLLPAHLRGLRVPAIPKGKGRLLLPRAPPWGFL
ncbi:UNVERIFIED_CONTAM: hypothetical protein Slati_3086200 [Sesamum latifolium]|uniref:Uncharacterized protein n=1 Tax=Sesamum latifolium TaxID=2727402 RepID=A0AAW2UVJ9_9LAMI